MNLKCSSHLVASPFAKNIALPRRPRCHCMVEAHSRSCFSPPSKQALARITPSYMDRNLVSSTEKTENRLLSCQIARLRAFLRRY
ncbi:hypothetical protein CCUS01_12558 [Colletotrichum cuscutae]|uniref:Uncharacterized protein n=1 Tax=Colletotrichum cuscutae TaxID=1209917 RepID=A0AAI9TU03_9PEZI|nr:hypothetical protein CCUS01_12558 [Colletotrichum cuscutae]